MAATVTPQALSAFFFYYYLFSSPLCKAAAAAAKPYESLTLDKEIIALIVKQIDGSTTPSAAYGLCQSLLNPSDKRRPVGLPAGLGKPQPAQRGFPRRCGVGEEERNYCLLVMLLAPTCTRS